MEIGYIERESYDGTHITVYSTVVSNMRGNLALKLIERWGLITGIADGEDSAGRAKINQEPINDLVKRAFECADKAYNELEKRDWLLNIPAPKVKEKTKV